MVAAGDLQRVAARARAALVGLEQELNAADAQLGDGDTGGMLSRVVERLALVEAADGDDLGKTFGAYAKAAAASTGSSLGTLLATGLLSFAKATSGKTSLTPAELGPILREARDAMLKRGQSQLGDKTVIDVIDAISKAVTGKLEWVSVASAATQSALAALAAFRDRPCKVGRARMFGAKSRGLDDPGMLAVARLVEAVSRNS